MGVNSFSSLHYKYLLCISFEAPAFYLNSLLIFGKKLISEGDCNKNVLVLIFKSNLLRGSAYSELGRMSLTGLDDYSIFATRKGSQNCSSLSEKKYLWWQLWRDKSWSIKEKKYKQNFQIRKLKKWKLFGKKQVSHITHIMVPVKKGTPIV